MKRRILAGYLLLLVMSLVIPFASRSPDAVERITLYTNLENRDALMLFGFMEGISNHFLAEWLPAATGITVLYVLGVTITALAARARASRKTDGAKKS